MRFRVLIPICLLVFTPAVPSGSKQQPPKKFTNPPVLTTVCKITGNPAAYNNTLVEVRGFVRANFEYSMLIDESCSEKAIWFSFADGSGPPPQAIIVSGEGKPGGKVSSGRETPPVSVHLVRDSNFEKLKHYWELSAKGEKCADTVPPPDLPDLNCATYRVTATFIGRIDGVSKKIHAAHLRRSGQDTTDSKGFGHMGMFDAQIVVQSVASVVAVEEPRLPNSR